ELGMLALLAERATILPPDQLYNAATLTAVAHAGETLVAGRSAFAATPTPALGTAVLGGLPIASLPPANVVCTVPPPGMLGSAIAADPSLAAQIGCPVGAVFSTTTAAQSFERGTMIYLQGSPSYI